MPEGYAPRRRKTAKERRAQRLRSEARAMQRLLHGLMDLQVHRGSQLSRVGVALRDVLQSDVDRGVSQAVCEPSLVAPEPKDIPDTTLVAPTTPRCDDAPTESSTSIPDGSGGGKRNKGKGMGTTSPAMDSDGVLRQQAIQHIDIEGYVSSAKPTVSQLLDFLRRHGEYNAWYLSLDSNARNFERQRLRRCLRQDTNNERASSSNTVMCTDFLTR